MPNPAHAQFIAREASDPIHETRALSETRARQLMAMLSGESLIALRDRAILKFYLYNRRAHRVIYSVLPGLVLDLDGKGKSYTWTSVNQNLMAGDVTSSTTGAGSKQH